MSRERNLSFTIGIFRLSRAFIKYCSDNIMEKDKPEIPTLNLAAQQAVMNPILQYNRLLTFQNHLNHLALQLTAPTLPATVQPYRCK